MYLHSAELNWIQVAVTDGVNNFVFGIERMCAVMAYIEFCLLFTCKSFDSCY